MRSILLICLLLSFVGKSQTIFVENMTNSSGGLAGTGIIRTTSASILADYLNASGGSNMELDNTQTLIIDGINAQSYTDILLSFAVRKALSSENGSNLTVSYSVSGSNGSFTPISWNNLPNAASSTGWYFRTSNTILPNNVTTIKFEATSDNWRIDDVSLFKGNPKLIVKGNKLKISENNTPKIIDFTDFESCTQNFGFQTNTFEIENKGLLPLEIYSVTNSNSTDFSVGINFPQIILPNEILAIPITFKPLASGVKNNAVTLQSNDPTQANFSFSVTGLGITPTACNTITQKIKNQFFENTTNDNWNYQTFINSGLGTLAVTNGTKYGESGLRAATPMFINGKSLQVNNTNSTVLFDVVNTLDYSNITLDFKLGAYSLSAGNGADVPDFVSVYISADGGVTWSHELQIKGYNNAKWSFNSGLGVASKIYNGSINPTLFQPTSGGYKINDGFSSLVLSQLPSAEKLQIKIILNNSTGNETWAIDNVVLSGTKKDIRTWENQTWSATQNGFANAKIIFNDDYETKINGNVEACECDVKPNKKLTVNKTNHLLLHGNLKNEGIFLVENTGSFIQINDEAINIGVGYIYRSSTPMKRYDYTYWSSAVAQQSIENFSLGPYYLYNPIVKKWQNTSGIMQAGKGYIIRAPNYVDYTQGNVIYNGVFEGIPNNGVIQIPLEIGESKWNLIGNPYPSAINADSLLNHPNNINTLNGTLYFWTHATGLSNGSWGKYSADDYALYNQTGGVAALNGSPIPDEYIASGQAFFAEALQVGNVIFTNSMREKENNTRFFKSTAIQKTKNRVWLEMVSEEGAYKQLLIGYMPNATNQLDRNFDGVAKKSSNTVGFYSLVNEVELSIQGREYPFKNSDEVPLGYFSNQDATYQIQLAKSEGDLNSIPLLIEDTQTGIVHDLTLSPYVFTTEEGVFNERFTLLYQEKMLQTAQIKTIENVVSISQQNNEISLSSSAKKIKTVVIYNSIGQKLIQKIDVNTSEYKLPLFVTKQLLIFKITLENDEVVTKKIIF